MQKHQQHRVKKSTLKEDILKFLHKYAYVETTILIAIYLFIGFMIDPEDVCILHYDVPFLLILLAILTLFHGFESGILAMSIASLAMLFSYDSFPYIHFLILLMMVLIFSEFHYYWNNKIKKAELEANYKGIKLEELSKAFYSLKISHDQLEKNYVIKPMSIRNALGSILSMNQDIMDDETIVLKKQEKYKMFLELLQKSFNVQSGLILYRKEFEHKKYFQPEVVDVVYGEYTDEVDVDVIFKNYIVDKAVGRKTPVYISDDTGEPSLVNELESKYIAAIPAIYDDEVISLLVIEQMPFMAFERENLTSIAILLEYFTIEVRKEEYIVQNEYIDFIEDKDYQFELARLSTLYNKYKVNSVLLVLKIDNELQAIRMFDKANTMLRLLDLSTFIKKNGFYYISLLFPLHDKAAAAGFLNRFISQLDEQDRNFLSMSFDLSRLDLFEDYINQEEHIKKIEEK